MNTEATLKAIDERTELANKALAKMINMLIELEEDNKQLKQNVQELRAENQEIKAELSENRLKALVRSVVVTDGVSIKDFATYCGRFNVITNGIYNAFEETKQLVKDESIKTQNASYSGGRSGVYA